MAEEFTIANFRHVADGLQAGQFDVGERKKAQGLADLDPIYRDLLDRPIPVVLAVIGPDGRPGLTPMWFDYEGDTILVNTASQRPKCEWIRKNPQLSMILVNPENAYHWMSMKVTVVNEVLERKRRMKNMSPPIVTKAMGMTRTLWKATAAPDTWKNPSCRGCTARLH